jgi:hypothetical protein
LLVHDDRCWPFEGATQASKVLMVMEGIASAPVDQLNFRIGALLTVE